MRILSVYITEQQERTWGRVYVQYKIKDEFFFIFKNWLKFDEKTFIGNGLLDDASVYNWFLNEKRHISTKKMVLDGKMDHLNLTSKEFKQEYGTPSIILKRLLIELAANVGEPVKNRTGWYDRYRTLEPNLSSIEVEKIKGKYRIYLSTYKTEIDLPPIQKAIYILFLENPNGIRLKDFYLYETQLQKWLERTSVHTQNKDIKKSKRLLDLSNNALNETLAEIKKSIIQQLGKLIAQHYFISGKKAEKYSIKIPAKKIRIKKI